MKLSALIASCLLALTVAPIASATRDDRIVKYVQACETHHLTQLSQSSS